MSFCPLGEVAMGCIVSRCLGAMALAWLVATLAIAGEADLPELIYSPWIKFCLSDTCFIGKDGRSKADCAPVVAAVLIERNGDTKKILRVTLPSRLSVERGVRMTIDQGPAIERPYVSYLASGCLADYDTGAELVDQLKQGRMLV